VECCKEAVPQRFESAKENLGASFALCAVVVKNLMVLLSYRSKIMDLKIILALP
jgi:hypothetical protein